jgi:hypothetical protein
MIFSEAYNLAEELAKDGSHDAIESGISQDAALSAEPESYSEDSWSSQPSDFPSDAFGYDVEEVPTVTGSNSPPLEDLSLTSVRDSSPPAPAVPDGLGHTTETTSTADVIHDQPVVEPIAPHEETVAPLEHSSSVTPTSTTDVGTTDTDIDIVEEALAAENPDFMESAPESEKQHEAPLETPLEPSPETEEVAAGIARPPAPSSEPVQDNQSSTEQEQEISLNLSEPQPSEPIPPESESDITDEVHNVNEEPREVVEGL